MKRIDLETPALTVDIRAMRRNMKRMADVMASSPMKFYPHYKSHKCPAIAWLQLAAGADGITCSKLGEAEDLCDAGIPNIVLANQVVQPGKLPRLAAVAAKTRLTVCVDHAENVLALEKAMAARGGGILHVLVEFEVGQHRCGVDTFEEFLALAKLIEAQPHLSFEGIQAYAGHMSHEADAEKRREEILRIEDVVVRLKSYCEENGLQVAEICGGSTGFAKDKPLDTVYTQAQYGSYLFMDASFLPLGLDFEQALFVDTTVLSVGPDRAVVDCGTKTMTMDQDPPRILELPGAKLIFNEEHTMILSGSTGLKIGDRLRYIPGHCCTTINIFDEMAVLDGDDVVDVWKIASRGKAQ